MENAWKASCSKNTSGVMQGEHGKEPSIWYLDTVLKIQFVSTAAPYHLISRGLLAK